MDENRREGRGRSEKKRAAHAIEVLAQRMVESTDALYKRLPLPDELRKGLQQARSIRTRGARKRQIKYLAGLLRQDEESVAACRAALDAVDHRSRAERDRFQHIEEIRDALCDPDRFDEAIEEAEAEFPEFDHRTFTRLAGSVHQTGDKRASREIFRRLRGLMDISSET